jgi:ATP-dependent RNA helicase RhlE
MNLKKIDEQLAQGLENVGINTANVLQSDMFSALKSGTNYVIEAPKDSGKTTLMVMHIIQRLKKQVGENPRALIIVPNRSDVDYLGELFSTIGAYNNLRVFKVYDHGDIDYDKNLISLGIDVLIGTPNKLNLMFGSAGFNGNTLQIISFFNANELITSRYETILHRLCDSILKAQRVIWCEKISEKIENLALRVIEEPIFYEYEEE